MQKIFIHPDFYSVKKRCFDFTLALVLLGFSLPFLVILSPFLFYLIGKPILFKQQRTGINGRAFTLFKIRRMVKNAEMLKHLYLKNNQAPWPMFKMSQDPRSLQKHWRLPGNKNFIFRTGDLLSQSGLDELPQLINILKGEMSFFGPRPLPLSEAEKLKEIDQEWWQWRHRVKPGIFSVWAAEKKIDLNLDEWKELEIRTLKVNFSKQLSIFKKILTKQLKQVLY